MYLRIFPLLMVWRVPVLEKCGRCGDETIVNGCYSVLYVLKVLCCISVDEAKSGHSEETLVRKASVFLCILKFSFRQETMT